MSIYLRIKIFKKTTSLIALIIIACAFFIAGCSNDKGGDFSVASIGTASHEAMNPYLTTDNKGNAVLCWTERSPVDSLFRLKYAVYDERKAAFGPGNEVSVSAGTGVSPESMNKVLFKGDGTVVAFFTRRFPNEKNPYAGAICYSVSRNEGKNWTAARYLHSDTSHTYGRSFFDVSRLGNGELAAVWLDGRYGKADTGSALFFSRTTKGSGFLKDSCIARSTCECCRTALLTDDLGNLHVAYRSIAYPPLMNGRQIRDMMYIFSADGGNTFTKPVPLGTDNWQIDGCPHTGPSLAVTGQTVHALWFTGAGEPGIYYNQIVDGQHVFGRKELISSKGRHPQMVALKNGGLAMVWEEEISVHADHESAGGHDHMQMGEHHMQMTTGHMPAGASQIMLRLTVQGKPESRVFLTDGRTADHHAVIRQLKDGRLFIAWMHEEKDRSEIRYTVVKTD